MDRSFAIIASAALAACASEEEPPPCTPTLVSNTTYTGGAILSGTEVLGITWQRRVGTHLPEMHAFIVLPDGTQSADISVPLEHTGTTGKSTVLWHSARCSAAQPFTVIIQRLTGEPLFVDAAPVVRDRAVIFDGTQYQLFWVDGANRRMHRSLAEDGTLGEEHVVDAMAQIIGCLRLATDGAGTTYLQSGSDGYVFDPVTATKRLAFDAAVQQLTLGAFFYDGQFRTYGALELYSFPPTSTGTFTTQPLPRLGVNRFYPGTQSLFLHDVNGSVTEYDRNFSVLSGQAIEPSAIGTFANDLTYFVRTNGDLAARTPGYLELVRGTAWRKQLVADSPLEEVCE